MSIQLGARVDLLDRDGRFIGALVGVTGGKIDASIHTTIKSGGSISLREMAGEIDWLNVRVRPWREQGGDEWPLGVFIPAAPTVTYDDYGRVYDVQLLDRLHLLDRAKLGEGYEIAAGSDVVDAVAALISWTGEDPGPIESFGLAARTNIVWEPGETVLRVINDLLESVGAFSLWCDIWGNYRVTPSTAPATRPVVYEYVYGEEWAYEPRFTRTDDYYTAINRMEVVTQGDGDLPGLYAVAENDDPNDPLSTVNRGIVSGFEEVDAATQGILNDIAQRRLLDRGGSVETVEITHIPRDLPLNSAVRFVYPPAGIDARYVVTRTSTPIDDLALQAVTLRRVVG